LGGLGLAGLDETTQSDKGILLSEGNEMRKERS
jgi:hypothetical protein